MLLLLPVVLPPAPLVLQDGRLLRLLHVLVEVEGDLPLEGVADEFVVFVDHFYYFTVEVGEEVRDRRRQHLTLLEALAFVLWPHAFNELPEIGEFELVRSIDLTLIENVLVDLADHFCGLKVLDLRRVVNQIESSIVVFYQVLYLLFKIEFGVI